jgi:hypothetical protein
VVAKEDSKNEKSNAAKGSTATPKSSELPSAATPLTFTPREREPHTTQSMKAARTAEPLPPEKSA